MEWLKLLCISCLVFSAESQNAIQNPNILYPDHIYFVDNKPSVTPGNHQINTPNGNKKPVYGNADVVQVPVTQLNVVETSTTNWNSLVQRPVSQFNAVQAGYDQTVADSKNPGEFQTNTGVQIIRLDPTAVALTNFSINVMKNSVLQKQGNTVVSSHSIATVLSLLQQGAILQTLDQISGALQMPAQVSAAAFKRQNQDILSRRSRNILRTANNIFVAEAFSLNPQYKAVAINEFDSEVTATTFATPERTALLINNWIASKTNNKINNLIRPESLSVNTQMVLVNAIYFKGLWAVPFRATSNKVSEFTLSNGVKKQMPFMMARRLLKAGVDAQSGSNVVNVPFENDEYSMMIIVPSGQSSAQSILASLTVAQLENYHNFKSIEVLLKIPKFTVKGDTDLEPVLKQMGVTQIFEQNSGLVGLGMYKGYTPQVSSAVHSAVLSIDEQGGSAAAASAFSVVALSNDETPLLVRADRPFIAILWDEKTKVPLFMAKIEDPSVV